MARISYKESYHRAAEAAQSALGRMAELAIAPHPDNYEIWYAYHADVDATLSRSLSRLLNDYSPEAYQGIKQSYFRDEQAEMLKALSENAETTIAAALASIAAASDSAQDYGVKLADFAGGLDDAAPDRTRALVARMIVDTAAVMKRNAELETELQASRAHVAELCDSLDDARRASETDGLTGLPNRRAYDLGIIAEIERAVAENSPLSLLVADIDHFKDFNDTHGHRVGDEVLKLVARLMRSMLKGRDKPARYGGEEFCVILPTTNAEGAFAVAEHVRKAIAAKALKSARTGESYGQVTLSFGCATLAPGDTADSLYERGDAALFLAKRTGRNRTCTESELSVAQQDAV